MRSVAAASRILGPNASLIVPSTTQSVQDAQLSTGSPANSASGGNASNGIPVQQVLPGLQQSILGAPLLWLGGLALFLVCWKLIEEHRGGEAAFAKIRVDGTNIVKTTAMAMLGFIILKYFARAYQVPGLSPAILSA